MQAMLKGQRTLLYDSNAEGYVRMCDSNAERALTTMLKGVSCSQCVAAAARPDSTSPTGYGCPLPQLGRVTRWYNTAARATLDLVGG